MSDYQETQKELELRQVSENKNPFSISCKNRQLWSEGYRQCARDLAEWHQMSSYQKPPFDELVLVWLYTDEIILSTYRNSENEKEINLFDCEKENKGTVKAYRRISLL